MRAARHALAAAVAVAGCAQFQPPADGEVRGGAGDPCQANAAIEDGEDGDNRILVRGGRGGYLYTYADDDGSTVAPRGEFTIAAGGADGSDGALRMHGTLADADGAYAGLGLSLTEPKAPYDASRYTGISFSARRAPGSAAAVRLKLPDVNTDPEGGVCTECFNDFGIDFQVAEQWTRYVVAFADLAQGAGWGQPRVPALDASRLYSVQWQVATRGASFDIWIDDVAFVGCP